MDKKTLIASLRSVSAGAEFINQKQVQKALSFGSNDTVRKWLSGVEHLQNGREKLYLVSDVADAILERRVILWGNISQMPHLRPRVARIGWQRVRTYETL